MLQVNGIDTYYGDAQILKNVSLDVQEGELVAVIGANGAGKSTLINTITGIVKPKSGTITFRDEVISNLAAHQIVARGIVQVPENRLLFPKMTVLENLEMGAYLLNNKEELQKRLESVYALLPILRERSKQIAGTMSGGEQQMLAIGRAMMSSPKLMLFDEPSLGLAPKIVQTVFDLVLQINKEMGVSVLLVEQNVQHSCQSSDRAFVMENGEVVLQGAGPELLDNEHVRRAYLGL